MSFNLEKLRPSPGVFRILSIYVGQGESTLLMVPDGADHKYMLIDSNVDVKNSGVDLSRFLSDLLVGKLDVFINTHPHKDHLSGISEIFDSLGVKEIWHSGHVPGEEGKELYDRMKQEVKKIGKDSEYVLFGSNDLNKLRMSDKETAVVKKVGEVDFHVLSPADYVSDEVDGEKPEDRKKRIHEQCAAIKFTYANKSILIAGDADRDAWEKHITNYHREEISADVFSAPHHGSRSFFMKSNDSEDVYEDHIASINPEFLVVSAPSQKDSPHGHPHDEAMDLYKKYVKDENIYHLGRNKECVIIDIDASGNINVEVNSEIVDEYKHSDEDDEGGTKNNSSRSHQDISPMPRRKEYPAFSKPYFRKNL